MSVITQISLTDTPTGNWDLQHNKNRSFPCMEAAFLMPQRHSEMPLVRGFGWLEMCLYGIRELARSPKLVVLL